MSDTPDADHGATPAALRLSEGLGAAPEARCRCRACIRERGDTINGLPRLMCEFIVCPHCGDKRCLHAHNHAVPCAKVSLYEHNAWVERMALRTDPASGEDMPQLDAVIALGAWKAPNA
jgi:hypothetical protein